MDKPTMMLYDVVDILDELAAEARQMAAYRMWKDLVRVRDEVERMALELEQEDDNL